VSGAPGEQTSCSERNRGVGRVCAVWSAMTRRFPSSRRGLCHAPPIGCKLSTNHKRKPKWRRRVAASSAVGPSAILTGSRARPSDWGWNARFGPVEDRRNNRRLATVTGGCLLFFPVCFSFPTVSTRGPRRPPTSWAWNTAFDRKDDNPGLHREGNHETFPDFLSCDHKNGATRPPDRCLMVLRPIPDPRVVTRDGVALFGIDANCHGPLSQGG